VMKREDNDKSKAGEKSFMRGTRYASSTQVASLDGRGYLLGGRCGAGGCRGGGGGGTRKLPSSASSWRTMALGFY
jgi:hypothetical protein